MRLAVAGKGGAGKTTVAATLARLAAASGREVLCIDADSNPNLAVALGVEAGLDPRDTVLPATLVSRRLDGGPALREDVRNVLDRHTVPGPDGVTLTHLGMPGHAEEGCMCAAHGVVRALLTDLAGGTRLTVLDLEASPEHFSRGTASAVDVLAFVVEPYFRSLETARRMASLARELAIPRLVTVANKVRDERDRAALEGFAARHDLPLAAVVPWDDGALDADRDRRPLVEASPHGPAVTALREALPTLLGDRLTPAGDG